MVEEHERPDIPALGEGQQPAHGKPAEIALARLDDHVDGVGHGNFLCLRLSMDESAHARQSMRMTAADAINRRLPSSRRGKAQAAALRGVAGAFACRSLSACAPLQQSALALRSRPRARFLRRTGSPASTARASASTPTARAHAGQGAGPCDDGEGINLDTVDAASACAAAAEVYAAEPDVVIIAVHGMNDYAGAFIDAGEWWSANGATVYAYDQRGFGRSPGWMIWPSHDGHAEGSRNRRRGRARAPSRREGRRRRREHGRGRRRHHLRRLEPPRKPDALILSGPGFRGWGALPLLYSASLWVASHVRPDWVVVPPDGVRIVATDNNAQAARDVVRPARPEVQPHRQRLRRRLDHGGGGPDDRAACPDSVPTLMLYGAKDEMIPVEGVQRATAKMPRHVQTAYYVNGYHMLLNDLQAHKVWARYPGLRPRPGITPAVGRSATTLAG